MDCVRAMGSASEVTSASFGLTSLPVLNLNNALQLPHGAPGLEALYQVLGAGLKVEELNVIYNSPFDKLVIDGVPLLQEATCITINPLSVKSVSVVFLQLEKKQLRIVHKSKYFFIISVLIKKRD